ncbi:MAG: hypothetical protein IRZ21_02080 [Thermoleophilaceae bacterium]|nr:hypothetical protein [Thermoleophilaceae bacterium]
MHRNARFLLCALVAVLALVAAGCGGGNDNNGGGGGNAATGKKGGTLTIVDTAGGVDSLDPGYWYYQTDYLELAQPTQRWLYSWGPTDTKPRPDLAEGMPQVADGGKTLTIKIKQGVKYSPPLQDRTVSSKDIKYAMERCFLPQVGNGYAPVYYSDIVGVKQFQSGKAKEISGIQTPDDATLVLKLAKPVGVLANANALALPCTIPVPKDYAQKYDKGKTSHYGEHQVFTGPYMIQNDGKGNITGYQPAKSLVLVRNPSWDPSTDYRKAYLDKIVEQNGSDATVASRKILTGSHMISGDFAAPPVQVLKSALSSRKDQLSIAPSQGNRFISLNTKVKPFDDVNVRRAVSAITDRNALRLTRGGPALGPTATHFIPPGIPGFEEAGGMKGPGFDFVSNPNGDLAVAQKYMKAAGYKSGKYTGPPVLMVGDNVDPARKTGEAFQHQLAQIGIKLNYRQVPHATMLSKFCGVPKAAVAICPNLGWGKDFFDAQSMIDPVFNGKNIVPVGNANYSQANDPKLNALMDKAEQVIDPAERARLWGEIDKQVTNQAYVVTWLWDNQINLRSSDVNAVRNEFNSSWDLNFTSLK